MPSAMKMGPHITCTSGWDMPLLQSVLSKQGELPQVLSTVLLWGAAVGCMEPPLAVDDCWEGSLLGQRYLCISRRCGGCQVLKKVTMCCCCFRGLKCQST